MEYIDDRTETEHNTHTHLVTATDRFLSGWGKAKGGVSKCAWACKPEDVDRVYDWVSNRDEMKYVNITTNWKPRNASHVHIYIVRENHVSLE